MSIARLNFSHGTHQELNETIELLGTLSKETAKQIAILGDLQGPKIRLGSFSNGKTQLSEGQSFILTTKDVKGDNRQAHVDYQGITRDVSLGARVLMNDGLVHGVVKEIGNNYIILEITVGGVIGDHKGVNLPGTKVGLPALTDKDKADLTLALDLGFDYIACSFVREAEHINQVRSLIGDRKRKPKVLAKIETQEAVGNLREIIQASDGIMVARGDLAVEVPLEMVPIIQKVALKLCQEQDKFSITATQMLESMTVKPVPTRAEISDVANAVIDGTCAVMLSGESATGRYPIETVATMRKIIERIEKAMDDGKLDINDLIKY